MSKHLSTYDINRIVEIITAMRGPVTWPKVEKAIKRKLSMERSQWGLRQNNLIKAAYDAKQKPQAKEDSPKPKPRLTQKIKHLEEDNARLREQLAIVLGNAVEMGVPLERMHRPPTVIDYGSTPGRR